MPRAFSDCLAVAAVARAGSWRSTFFSDRSLAKRTIRSYQNGHRVRIVLGLGQTYRRPPARAGALSSATITTSDGPASRSTPTKEETSCLPAATQAFPGPCDHVDPLDRLGTVTPTRPTAWAPPMPQISSTCEQFEGIAQAPGCPARPAVALLPRSPRHRRDEPESPTSRRWRDREIRRTGDIEPDSTIGVTVFFEPNATSESST